MSSFGDSRSSRARERDRMPSIGDAFTAGLTLVVTLLLFLAAGAWADSRFGTSPGLSLFGAFIGAAVGIYRLNRYAVVPTRRDTEDR